MCEECSVVERSPFTAALFCVLEWRLLVLELDCLEGLEAASPAPSTV